MIMNLYKHSLRPEGVQDSRVGAKVSVAVLEADGRTQKVASEQRV